MVKVSLHDFSHITKHCIKDNSYYDTLYYESFDIVYNLPGYIIVLKAASKEASEKAAFKEKCEKADFKESEKEGEVKICAESYQAMN